jgi:hypothetical protein
MPTASIPVPRRPPWVKIFPVRVFGVVLHPLGVDGYDDALAAEMPRRGLGDELRPQCTAAVLIETLSAPAFSRRRNVGEARGSRRPPSAG